MEYKSVQPLQKQSSITNVENPIIPMVLQVYNSEQVIQQGNSITKKSLPLFIKLRDWKQYPSVRDGISMKYSYSAVTMAVIK